MVVYNDIFEWEGLGKSFGLASGRVRLRIFDLSSEDSDKMVCLRPIIVVVSDLPEEKVTVRGWAGPLASFVVNRFNINKNRMLWIEHYPAVQYGQKKIKHIPETYEIVDFTWKGDKAVLPRWRTLKPPLLDVVRELVDNT